MILFALDYSAMGTADSTSGCTVGCPTALQRQENQRVAGVPKGDLQIYLLRCIEKL